MTEQEHQRLMSHRLAVIRHAREVTGNVPDASGRLCESGRFDVSR